MSVLQFDFLNAYHNNNRCGSYHFKCSSILKSVIALGIKNFRGLSTCTSLIIVVFSMYVSDFLTVYTLRLVMIATVPHFNGFQ